MNNTNDEFNIKLIKKHIKNLINGNNISKAEMIELYKNVMNETISKKVDDLFNANNIDVTIEKYVNREIRSYLNKLMEPQSYWDKSRSNIESMIRTECDKQVKDIINANFKISLNGIEVSNDK